MTLTLILRRLANGVILRQHGESVAPPREIDPRRYRTLHFLTDLYRRHTLAPGPVDLTEQALIALGVEMFDLWLADLWPACHDSPARLVIATDDLELLILPWELLRPPGLAPLALLANWTLLRVPHGLPPEDRDGPAPCRLLFLQSQPQDRPALSCPWQEGITPLLPGLAHGRSCVLNGRRSMFHPDFQPELLFLQGHALVRNGVGHFCLCDEQGQTEVITADELTHLLAAMGPMQGLILCGREENHPPPVAAIHALARHLVGRVAPWVMAWPDAPLSEPCRSLASHLAQALTGNALPAAVTASHRASAPVDQQAGYPAWTLACLYGSSVHRVSFDTDHLTTKQGHV